MTIKLNRRLVLEEAVRVSDGAGGFSENWVPKGTLWAAIKSGSGRERFSTETNVSSVLYQIIVRGASFGAPSRPKPDQRFRDGSRRFVIVGVTEHGTEVGFLTCHAIEEVSG